MAKTALITGASRGIGAAVAETLAADGYNLSLCCRSSGDRLNALAASLHRRYGVQVRCALGDVGSCSFAREMTETALAEFGHIDVLVNNAGISHVGLLTDMQIEDWEHVMRTNLTSVFSMCRLAAPSMIARRSGRIINISSVWGRVGAACEAAYSASKGGMNAFTKAFGKELAPSGIPVNAVACGAIDTEMNRFLSDEERACLTEEIPAGRMGTPEEAAALVLLLCRAPVYLTGQILTLDGGWT